MFGELWYTKGLNVTVKGWEKYWFVPDFLLMGKQWGETVILETCSEPVEETVQELRRQPQDDCLAAGYAALPWSRAGRWAWSVLGVIELLGWPRSHLPMAVRSFPILESETPSPCTSSLFSTWSGALSSDCFINSHFWLSEAKSTGKHTLPLQF